MRREGGFGWRRLAMLCLAANVAVAMTAGPVSAAYQASVYDNRTAFTTCIGQSSTIPQSMRTMAVNAFRYLGYTPSSYEATGFTSSTALSRAGGDQAFYVFSHGDHYYTGWGFRADGGVCNQAIVTSGQIKAKRLVSGYVKSANLVVASTCHLGETASDFPLAFGIAKLRSTPTGANHQGQRFFLGYSGVAWTDEMYAFESKFWKSATTGSNLGDAYYYALRNTSLLKGTAPNWWGSYTYAGVPFPPTPCYTCL
ncbi:MAG: hypothetical protein M0Z49_11860 [Chloroflexi bacterium]|nr:hypothetical protein [Chloroflexota bacterium]